GGRPSLEGGQEADGLRDSILRATQRNRADLVFGQAALPGHAGGKGGSLRGHRQESALGLYRGRLQTAVRAVVQRETFMRWGVVSSLLVVAGVLGCARNPRERYIPTADAARQALEAALNAWQNGEPPGLIDTLTPSVQVADSFRRAGQRLGHFEIL